MYCIDAGSIYCPCHLAETKDCILCSQLSGEESCQCKNWRGVCIYEQYISNGKKSKKLRKTYFCSIIDKKIPEDNLCIFTISAPEGLVRDLTLPGSFIFLRDTHKSNYSDVPVSIMEADIDKATLKFAIKLNGTKTKSLFKVNKTKQLLVRGPFANGILGLSNIHSAKNGTSIIIGRGIGIAPSIPIIKELDSNNNRVISIIDNQFKYDFSEKYFSKYNCEKIDCTILENGDLTDKFRSILNNILSDNDINLIHCGGADIMIYKILQFVDKPINFSCCNNAKMVCGEGICASCTKNYKDDIVRRLCKVQMDPKKLFQDRRFI